MIHFPAIPNLHPVSSITLHFPTLSANGSPAPAPVRAGDISVSVLLFTLPSKSPHLPGSSNCIPAPEESTQALSSSAAYLPPSHSISPQRFSSRYRHRSIASCRTKRPVILPCTSNTPFNSAAIKRMQPPSQTRLPPYNWQKPPASSKRCYQHPNPHWKHTRQKWQLLFPYFLP